MLGVTGFLLPTPSDGGEPPWARAGPAGERDQPCKRLREGAENVGPGWFLEHLYPASLAARDFDLFVDVMLLN